MESMLRSEECWKEIGTKKIVDFNEKNLTNDTIYDVIIWLV
jgi:hypothetical protein